MKKLLTVLFLFLFFKGPLYAQILTGQVLDSQTRKPVEFVSLGVLHRDAGTVASETGNFSLNLRNTQPTDTLKISMLGYESLLFTVQQFEKELTQKNNVILLQPQSRNLAEVIIRPRKTKTIITGNTTNTRVISAGFASNDLGSEVGTVLKYKKKKPGKIETVNFNIAYNDFNNLLFRVNIYDFKNGRIGENLLKEPLYLETGMESGTLSLDISDKNIFISHDCLLTLEWIKDYGKKGLMFSAGLINADSYARKISQGDWFKAPAGLGFWATVLYEK